MPTLDARCTAVFALSSSAAFAARTFDVSRFCGEPAMLGDRRGVVRDVLN